MQLQICDFLKEHSLNDAKMKFGINYRLDESKTKLSLNYDQLESKKSDVVAEQCRGLVIRPKQLFENDASLHNRIVGDVDVLAWPMNRFYGCDDHCASMIDYSDKDLSIYEKLDGTMIIMYWDQLLNSWCAGTRGVCDGSFIIKNNDISFEENELTFSKLFFDTLQKFNPYSNELSIFAFEKLGFKKGVTYVFELTSRFNRIVVDYKTSSIHLLAIRNTQTGKEIHINDNDFYKVHNLIPRPKIFKFKSLKQLQFFVNSHDADKFEGVVAVDSRFNRVKIKNKSWLIAHRFKDSIDSSKRNILRLIIDEQITTILNCLDESSVKKVHDLKRSFNNWCEKIDSLTKECSISTNDKKSFALFAQQHAPANFATPMYAIRDNKVTSTKSWAKKFCISDSIIDKVLYILEDYDTNKTL